MLKGQVDPSTAATLTEFGLDWLMHGKFYSIFWNKVEQGPNRVPELCLFAYCRRGHTTAVAEYPDNVEPNTQISKAPAPFCRNLA